MVVSSVAVVGGLGLTATAFGLPPFTTAPKSSAGGGGQSELFEASAACHASFDRLVVRARFVTPAYRVRYVQKIVSDGSGATVPLGGTKRIRVLFPEARAHRESDGAALAPQVLTPRCSNLRQVKLAGDFEGVVTFGLGLQRKRGFRVFRLTSPERVVVDVAH